MASLAGAGWLPTGTDNNAITLSVGPAECLRMNCPPGQLILGNVSSREHAFRQPLLSPELWLPSGVLVRRIARAGSKVRHVATTTHDRRSLTPRQRVLRSTVALKTIMAVSGILMILFLIAHMYGNLMAFGGRETFDTYTAHLHGLFRPILPREGFLWVLRVVMGIALLAHILSAVMLSVRDWRARGGIGKRYQTSRGRRGVQRSYASFTLRWGGVVILLYVIFHLLNLTAGTIQPGGATDDPYHRLVRSFGVWWVVASYTVALLAVGFHLRHGVWSALTQLGAHVSAKARSRLKALAYFLAVVITVGFLLVPWSIVTGIIR